MRKNLWLMIVVFASMRSLASKHCFAEASCPWINAETVQGILGGEIQNVSVSPPNAQGDTTCEFAFKQGDAASMFDVAVYMMSNPEKDFDSYLAQCHGTKTAFTTAGNEAIHCISNKGEPIEEQVIGRVREKAFVLTLHRESDLPIEKRSGANNYIRDMAEEVAGNLF